MGEIASLMDANRSQIGEGDKELHPEMEDKAMELAPDKDQKQHKKQLDSKVIQKQVKIQTTTWC